jgi:hypothetical protein
VAVCDPVMTGETLRTSGAASGSLSASTRLMVSEVFWVCTALPPRAPPLVIVNVLVPNRSMLAWICLALPLPTATSRITAATPMRMPSTVRPDRSLLAVTPRIANRTVS